VKQAQDSVVVNLLNLLAPTEKFLTFTSLVKGGGISGQAVRSVIGITRPHALMQYDGRTLRRTYVLAVCYLVTRVKLNVRKFGLRRSTSFVLSSLSVNCFAFRILLKPLA